MPVLIICKGPISADNICQLIYRSVCIPNIPSKKTHTLLRGKMRWYTKSSTLSCTPTHYNSTHTHTHTERGTLSQPKIIHFRHSFSLAALNVGLTCFMSLCAAFCSSKFQLLCVCVCVCVRVWDKCSERCYFCLVLCIFQCACFKFLVVTVLQILCMVREWWENRWMAALLSEAPL